jgi:ankyrin repeat protein
MNFKNALFLNWPTIHAKKINQQYIPNGPFYRTIELSTLALQTACFYEQQDLFELLLSYPQVDPCADYNSPLMHAIRNNRSNFVEILLKDSRVDPSAEDNAALQLACMCGCKEIIELLMKDSRVDPSAHHNKAIKKAIEYTNDVEIVKLLLKDPRVVPDIQVLVSACKTDSCEVVQLLLQGT